MLRRQILVFVSLVILGPSVASSCETPEVETSDGGLICLDDYQIVLEQPCFRGWRSPQHAGPYCQNERSVGDELREVNLSLAITISLNPGDPIFAVARDHRSKEYTAPEANIACNRELKRRNIDANKFPCLDLVKPGIKHLGYSKLSKPEFESLMGEFIAAISTDAPLNQDTSDTNSSPTADLTLPHPIDIEIDNEQNVGNDNDEINSTLSACDPSSSPTAPATSTQPCYAKFFTLPDGSVYDGEWYKTKLHGRGKLQYPNGDTYLGDFRINTMSGQGKMSYADGSYYEGEWRGGKWDGEGSHFNSETSELIVGTWKNGKLVKENEESKLAKEKRQAEEAARLAEEKRQAEEAARLALEEQKAELERLQQEQQAKLDQEREALEKERLALEEAKANQIDEPIPETLDKNDDAEKLAEEKRQAEEAARLAIEEQKAELEREKQEHEAQLEKERQELERQKQEQRAKLEKERQELERLEKERLAIEQAKAAEEEKKAAERRKVEEFERKKREYEEALRMQRETLEKKIDDLRNQRKAIDEELQNLESQVKELGGSVNSGETVPNNVSSTEEQPKKNVEEEAARLDQENRQAQERQNNASTPKYGTRGFIMLGNHKMGFSDVEIEGNSLLDMPDNNSGNVTIFGYINDFHVKLSNDPFGRLEFKVHKGDPASLDLTGAVGYTHEGLIEVVVNPQDQQLWPQDKFKLAKKTVVAAKGEKKLVKITGKFSMYTNTFTLYFYATKVEIIE